MDTESNVLILPKLFIQQNAIARINKYVHTVKISLENWQNLSN